jgi:hypothetical protein
MTHLFENRYGIEGFVHISDKKGTTSAQDPLVYNAAIDSLECPINGQVISLFRRVVVQLTVEIQSSGSSDNDLDEVGSMRNKLCVALIEPTIPGLSIEPTEATSSNSSPRVRSLAEEEERIVKRIKAMNPTA